jgi:CHAT domain-containing protein
VLDVQAPSLARQLCYPKTGLDGKQRTFADEIVHISCHCEAEPGSDSDDFALWLACDCHDEQMRIRLADLAEEMMLLWMSSPRSSPDDEENMPLVFLNACGTSALDPASGASFVRPFYVNNNRSVVAVSANVGDRMAAEVSRCFYTELFRGATVGEAVHEARWRLLQDRGNPLGLLYSVHNFAELRVLPKPSSLQEV